MINIPIMNNNVRKLRKSKGWTQEQLAEKMNISQSALSKIEKGSGSTGSLRDAAKHLDVPFFMLFVDSADEALASVVSAYLEADPSQRQIFHRLSETAKDDVPKGSQ